MAKKHVCKTHPIKYFDVRKNNKERKKSSRKQHRKQQHDFATNIIELNAPLSSANTAYSTQKNHQSFQAKTAAQQRYVNAIRNHCVTFGIGPAGTGKSYCAGALAAQALESGHIEKIILTRPAVEAGEQLGFLPGELNDKFSVYIDAFREILYEFLGSGTVDYCIRHGRIIAAPLAYMRGKTFKNNTFVILDEAQNTSIGQMKMFLTRIGENCKMVINGDPQQSDIHGQNGLTDAINRLHDMNHICIHQFKEEDVVRSTIVRSILSRYQNQEVCANKQHAFA